jgi:serine-threonine kinase receptor-associated protein
MRASAPAWFPPASPSSSPAATTNKTNTNQNITNKIAVNHNNNNNNSLQQQQNLPNIKTSLIAPTIIQSTFQPISKLTSILPNNNNNNIMNSSPVILPSPTIPAVVVVVAAATPPITTTTTTPITKSTTPPPPTKPQIPTTNDTTTPSTATTTTTGRNIICPGHSRPVVDVRFCSIPTLPSCLLISASHDKLPMIRWGDNGNWIGTLKGHQGATWSSALNFNGSLAATGSADFSVKIWDAIHGKELKTFTHSHVVKTVDFSTYSSGQYKQQLLCGGLDKILSVYDLNTSVREYAIQHESIAIQKAVWISANNVITGGNDGAIRLFDLRQAGSSCPITCTWIKEGVKKPIADLEFSSLNNNTLLAVSGKRVGFYDVRVLDKQQNTLDVTFDAEAASLSPNGGLTCLVGGSDLWLHVFDVETLREIQTNKGHHGPIFCVRYDPTSNGKRAASGAEDGTIRLWGNLAVSGKE